MAAGTFSSSVRGVDVEKPSEGNPQVAAHHGNGIDEGGRRLVIPCRLPLGYGAPLLQGVAAREIQENRPIRTGVVRAMARPDHWRWVSTPR